MKYIGPILALLFVVFLTVVIDSVIAKISDNNKNRHYYKYEINWHGDHWCETDSYARTDTEIIATCSNRTKVSIPVIALENITELPQ